MQASNLFFDDKPRLRSGWRVAVFVVAFYICAQFAQLALLGLIGLLLHRPLIEVANSQWNFVASHGAILISAALVGWGCGALLEKLPLRALGVALRKGWLKDLAVGSAFGAATLMLAALLGTATRGFHFSLDSAGAESIVKTLAISGLVFIFAAVAEELLFRGYPLQTLTRARLAWLGILLTSVPFAAVHLGNPNVMPGFTFVNTALAGVWLAAGYLRTRRLWFPIAMHWAWNWAQASLLGLPVSGISRIAPAPLLHAMNTGPDWITGGDYGIEGGAACTFALLISILIIWRTKLLARSDVPIEYVSEARASARA